MRSIRLMKLVIVVKEQRKVNFNLSKKVSFCDEDHFHWSGVVNTQNCPTGDSKNPYALHEKKSTQSVLLWILVRQKMR